ncbi:alpha/beta fold hydrolase [Phreatobacter stygius]|uniref:Alpha/beta hydrolase n=1 Tax=Phreatobacter stygius TaxID=1940610 RepID=A0A4D7BJS3_9HYPH|nr:alpha/beta hydrolase [Phreatobacter stygius]QCI67967.1 alpha/beta hydrolase [Phreatobacter stygius]
MLTLDRRFRFRGQSVAWGSMGDGPPLVMIHGTPFSAQVWRRIAPLAASRRRVFVFDLLGYGQSEQGDGQDVSPAVQTVLFAALLREWGLETPEILAHDFGGMTALRAHYLHACRYHRLTLVNPVALPPSGSPFFRHVAAHEQAFAGLPDYAHDALLRVYIQGAARDPLTDEAMAIYMAPWQGETGRPAFYRQVAQMNDRYLEDIEPSYGPMDWPVEILWGEQDRWIPIAQGERLASKLTGGALTGVPDAGHLVQEDAPEAIVAALFKGL